MSLNRFEATPETMKDLPRGSYAVLECHPDWKGIHWVLSDGRRVDITIRCPECGVHITLSPEIHRIAPDGTLTPSLVCPIRDCSWHVVTSLADWKP